MHRVIPIAMALQRTSAATHGHEQDRPRRHQTLLFVAILPKLFSGGVSDSFLNIYGQMTSLARVYISLLNEVMPLTRFLLKYLSKRLGACFDLTYAVIGRRDSAFQCSRGALFQSSSDATEDRATQRGRS